MNGFESRPGRVASDAAGEGASRDASGPGKRTLAEQLPAEVSAGAGAPVQRKAAAGPAGTPESVHEAAEHGVSGSSTRLPHLDLVQRSFGRHDVSGVKAHTDGAAAEGASAMG